ncbi:hypothetical protein HID58_088103, partial [Brassica napus]
CKSTLQFPTLAIYNFVTALSLALFHTPAKQKFYEPFSCIYIESYNALLYSDYLFFLYASHILISSSADNTANRFVEVRSRRIWGREAAYRESGEKSSLELKPACREENDHKLKFSVSLLNTDIKEELKNWLGEKTSSSRETLEETECKEHVKKQRRKFGTVDELIQTWVIMKWKVGKKRVKSPCSFTQREIEYLTDTIHNGGTEVMSLDPMFHLLEDINATVTIDGNDLRYDRSSTVT